MNFLTLHLTQLPIPDCHVDPLSENLITLGQAFDIVVRMPMKAPTSCFEEPGLGWNPSSSSLLQLPANTDADNSLESWIQFPAPNICLVQPSCCRQQMEVRSLLSLSLPLSLATSCLLTQQVTLDPTKVSTLQEEGRK